MKPERTTLILAVATIVALAAVAGVLGLGALYGTKASGTVGSTSETVLPAGCTRPAGGFLIILSKYGYNNSMLQGAGLSKPWPVMNATVGQTVKVEVCNVDVEAHGFQIAHYVDSSINVVGPGESLNFTFVANQQGTFQIYCAIPCSIHFFMQFGQLRVTAKG
jgi:FtsP/CotA-like multicopper oxidase with cupredoxin domain